MDDDTLKCPKNPLKSNEIQTISNVCEWREYLQIPCILASRQCRLSNQMCEQRGLVINAPLWLNMFRIVQFKYLA